MIKPFHYENYAPNRYTVESVFGDGLRIVYSGDDCNQAHLTAEFWDAKQDTYFTDNYLEQLKETPLAQAFRKLDALEQHILRS